MAGMGWGGVIASALAGGASGAMSSVAKDIDDQQKAALQAQRDERLAQLAQQTHKVNAESSAKVALENVGPMADAQAAATIRNSPGLTDAAVAAENAKLKGTQAARAESAGAVKAAEDAATTRDVAPGHAQVKGGKEVYSRDRQETQAEEDLKKAQAAEARARARLAEARADGKVADNEDGGGKKGGEKPRNDQKFDWVQLNKTSEGQWYQDKVTGIYKLETPDKPAKKGETRVFGPNDPDTKFERGGTKYFDQNKQNEISVDELKADRSAASGKTAPVPVKDLVPGKVVAGFRFLGGDKRNPKNWEPI